MISKMAEPPTNNDLEIKMGVGICLREGQQAK